MKKKQRFCWASFVFAVCFLAVFSAFSAWAKDSGEERFVPIIEWHCYSCNAQYFTFDPDDVGGASKADHKMRDYQQKNWMLLSDPGRPIPLCSKAPDGAHFFEKKRQMTTSPYIIHERRKDYIVLKDGRTVKAKLKSWTCKLCNTEGYCFDGDDMDLGEPDSSQKAMNLYNMANESRIKDCGFKAANGVVYRRHNGMQQKNIESVNSYGIAQRLSRIWYSD